MRSDELLIGGVRAPLDDLRDHPHRRGRVILVTAAGWPVQLPLREALHPERVIVPVQRLEGRRREPGGMHEQLLHRDVVLMVRRKLRNDVHDQLILVQLALLHEDPGRGRGDGLGGREDAEQRVVVRIAYRLEQHQFAVPGQSDLRGRQQPIVHFLASPRQESGKAQVVDPVFFRIAQPAVFQISLLHVSRQFLQSRARRHDLPRQLPHSIRY